MKYVQITLLLICLITQSCKDWTSLWKNKIINQINLDVIMKTKKNKSFV